MTERVHVYVVLDPHVQLPDGLEHLDVDAPVSQGDIFTQEQRIDPGAPGIVEHGPAKIVFQPGYLGAWGVNDDGQPAFPTSTARIIELLTIGTEQEQLLRKQLHAAFDQVKEYAESLKMDDDVRHDLFVRMDQIEKRLQ